MKFILFRFVIAGKKGAVGARPGKALSWAQRVNIALSSAEGIEFIYEKADHCITHRVIKPSNILLFDNDVAKVIGDIGAFESNPGHKINPDPLYYAFPPPHWSNLDGYGAPEYVTKITYVPVFSYLLLGIGEVIYSPINSVVGSVGI